jgi:hypothetical protein
MTTSTPVGPAVSVALVMAGRIAPGGVLTGGVSYVGVARGRAGRIRSMSKLRLIWDFLKVRKKWWLTPIVLFLILMSLLIVLTEGSAVSPFIYALF